MRNAEIVMAATQETVAAVRAGKAVGKNVECLETVRGSMAR